MSKTILPFFPKNCPKSFDCLSGTTYDFMLEYWRNARVGRLAIPMEEGQWLFLFEAAPCK